MRSYERRIAVGIAIALAFLAQGAATARSAPSVAATIAVNPTTGTAGTAVAVTGANFFAGETVAVKDATDALSFCSARAGSNGSFSCQAAVPASAHLGKLKIVATGKTSRQKAVALFTVTQVWSVTPSPGSGILSAVSCASTTYCVAVGAPLAEVWNGTAWAIQSTPTPTGSVGSHLDGVSCTSSAACTAVGSYTDSAGTDLTLVEAWDGSAWNIQTSPNPSGSKGSYLTGVSCTSSAACLAVGYYRNNFYTNATLAEVWNGVTWAIQPMPNPNGAPVDNLYGVSCTSPTACIAVGTVFVGSGGGTLAEKWDGTTWAILPTPSPQTSNLYGVSCTSPMACTAVGYRTNGPSSPTTLAEVWNGTAWTIQPTPNPGGSPETYLYGVSCTSPTACNAVGFYKNSAGSDVTLAEIWNRTAWTIQPTPNPGGSQSFLNGVSCTSPTACNAVGSSSGTLVETAV